MKRDELYITIQQAIELEPAEYGCQEKCIGGIEIRLQNRRIRLFKLTTGIRLVFKRYLPSIKRITVAELDLTNEAAVALLETLASGVELPGPTWETLVS